MLIDKKPFFQLYHGLYMLHFDETMMVLIFYLINTQSWSFILLAY